MTAVDPEGRIRHPLDVYHSTLEPDGDFVPAGYVPMADGLGQVEYVDSTTLGGVGGSLDLAGDTGTAATIDDITFIGAGGIAVDINDLGGGAAEVTIDGSAVSGGGGGGAADLPLDIPPGSPSSYDDEFPGSSLDAKWTAPITSSSGMGVTTSVANGWLTLEPTTSGTSSTGKRGAFGIRQASPNVSFTAMCKVVDGLSAGGTDDSRVGLWVGKTGGKAYIIGHQTSVPRTSNADGITTYSESADWSGYDGTDSFTVSPQNQIYLGTWYRMVYDSSASTLVTYFSTDGLGWILQNTFTSVTQPDRMGLAIWSNNGDTRADHKLYAKWFRVTTP